MRARAAIGFLAAAIFAAPAALAQPAAPPAAPQEGAPHEDPAERLAKAKDLFRRGVDLLNAGDCRGALELFKDSRKLMPSGPNTKNAAICLDRLGQFDEALEMYGELLHSFENELTPEEHVAVVQIIRGLGQKVGGILVHANVDGEVFVDRRSRGRLPLSGPIPVLKTDHTVRIVKEGYIPFEMDVVVASGALVPVDARLRVLPGVGFLRVEDSAGEATNVFVDGRSVGVTPWEGVVAPGRHIVFTRQGNRGSLPTAIVSVQGQTALARMASSVLGDEIHIEASPAAAEIAVDRTSLGARAWDGRLPVGLHEVSASAAGYKAESRSLMVMPTGSAETPPHVLFSLRVDPTYRPPILPPADPPSFLKGHPFAAVFGGLASSPRLGARLAPCRSPCEDPPAIGGLFGFRGGYRLGFGLAFEVAGGYLSLGSRLSSLRGLFPAVGISYRVSPVRWLGLLARVTGGLVGAQSGKDRNVVPSIPGFVMPEVGADVSAGHWLLGLGLGMGIFPARAPEEITVPHGTLTPYGPFLLIAPQAAATYSFD